MILGQIDVFFKFFLKNLIDDVIINMIFVFFNLRSNHSNRIDIKKNDTAVIMANRATYNYSRK
jgi:hypothetical protein